MICAQLCHTFCKYRVYFRKSKSFRPQPSSFAGLPSLAFLTRRRQLRPVRAKKGPPVTNCRPPSTTPPHGKPRQHGQTATGSRTTAPPAAANLYRCPKNWDIWHENGRFLYRCPICGDICNARSSSLFYYSPSGRLPLPIWSRMMPSTTSKRRSEPRRVLFWRP